jgi:hypothetical protein
MKHNFTDIVVGGGAVGDGGGGDAATVTKICEKSDQSNPIDLDFQNLLYARRSFFSLLSGTLSRTVG